MSEQQKDFILTPNAQEQDYFCLSEDNHTIAENGDILMTNVKLFHLNWQSLWRKGNFYPSCDQALKALHDWCEKFKTGVFGELNNPDLDKMKDAGERERYARALTIEESQRVVDYTNLRVVTELNGQPLQPGAHLVVDVRFPGKASLGHALGDYLKNGGLFRFSLRSTCDKKWAPDFTWNNIIHELITFDIITKEIDDRVAAEILQREAERNALPQVESLGTAELTEPPADEALDNPPAELHPKTQALMRRATVSGCENKAELDKHMTVEDKAMYLEKRDSE